MQRAFIVDEQKTFKLNAKASVRVLHVGDAKHRVVVVDNFYDDEARVRELVLKSPATRSPEVVNHSPGFRAVVRLDLSEPLESIDRQLRKTFRSSYASGGFREKGLFGDFVGNLITTRDAATPEQVRPHWDPNVFVGLVYLNPASECRGGTAFYRHRATGLQRIPANEAQLNEDQDDLNEAMDRCKLKDARDLQRCLLKGSKSYTEYMSDSNDHWELIEMIPMKPNRLILYEGNLFHSAYLKSEWFKRRFRIAQLFAF